MASTILDRLTTELVLNVVHTLDSYSMRDLLRAFRSLSDLAIIVLGPGYANGSSPSFFTGFASAICEYSSHQEDQLVLKRFPIKLYEVNTRVSLSLTDFINSELKHLKGMSFIHFKGNLNPLGDTRVMKTLNSMHTPYAPRISFEYCARKAKYNIPKKYICFPSVLKEASFSIKHTNISIDSRYLTEIGDIKFKHIKQLEIRFYKSESIPIIRDLDLPNVTVFSVKYYRKIPLMKNIKVGYGNTELVVVKCPEPKRPYLWPSLKSLNIGHEFERQKDTPNTIFELFDTSGFDVHYGFNSDQSTSLSDYEGHMDWGFTENFNSFFLVGGSMIMIFTMLNLENATTFFWYDSVFHGTHWDDSPKCIREKIWLDTVFCGSPKVKSFTYFTSNANGCLPKRMKLDQDLETVRLYCNNHKLNIYGIIGTTLYDPDEESMWSHDYGNRLTIVDICCDLPLWARGGRSHIVVDTYTLVHILNSPGTRYVNISGCYLGENNGALFKEIPPFPSAYFGYNPVFYKKEFKIELVRKMETEVDQGDVLVFNILSSLRNYLSSLTITQVEGGAKYRGWTGLSTLWPDHMLSNGLKLQIDPTFGTPTVAIESVSAPYPYKLTIATDSPGSSVLFNDRLHHQWTILLIYKELLDPPVGYIHWKMVPGFITPAYSVY